LEFSRRRFLPASRRGFSAAPHFQSRFHPLPVCARKALRRLISAARFPCERFEYYGNNESFRHNIWHFVTTVGGRKVKAGSAGSGVLRRVWGDEWNYHKLRCPHARADRLKAPRLEAPAVNELSEQYIRGKLISG